MTTELARRAPKRRAAPRERVGALRGSAAMLALIVHAVARNGGQPLEAETRALTESRFEHDFSHRPRPHRQRRRAVLQAVDAQPIPSDSRGVFGAARSSRTASGAQLLAHELADFATARGRRLPSGATRDVATATSTMRSKGRRSTDILDSGTDASASGLSQGSVAATSFTAADGRAAQARLDAWLALQQGALPQ